MDTKCDIEISEEYKKEIERLWREAAKGELCITIQNMEVEDNVKLNK
jgi:hypothetical protein